MKGKIWNRAIKFGVLIMVMAALLSGMAFTATAQSTPPAATALHNAEGKVTSVNVNQSNFVIQNGTQSPLTITVNPNTKYYLIQMGQVQTYVNNQVAKAIKQDKGNQTPAGALKQLHIPANWRSNLAWLETFNTKAQFSNIQNDDRIIARVDVNNLAAQVLIIKAPVNQTVKGTISAVSANSTTITPLGANPGNPVTLGINAKTVVNLKGLLSVQVGQYAVAVYNKNTLIAQTLNVQATAPAPPVTLTSITVTSAVSGNLTMGTTRQFVATGTYSNGSTINITSQVSWASSSSSVATISTAGIATGVAAGSTGITASKNGILSPVITLTVSP